MQYNHKDMVSYAAQIPSISNPEIFLILTKICIYLH